MGRRPRSGAPSARASRPAGALARRGVGPDGVGASPGRARMGDGQVRSGGAASSRGGGSVWASSPKGWSTWPRLDAMFALRNGNLAAARLKPSKVLRWRSARARPCTRLASSPCSLRSSYCRGSPRSAHARLKEQREWLRSIGFGPAGYAKANVWSLDVEALIALGSAGGGRGCPGRVAGPRGGLQQRQPASYRRSLRGHAAGRPRRPRRGDRRDGSTPSRRICAVPDRSSTAAPCSKRARSERRAKRKAAAKQTLEQALAILEPLGAQIWVSRARDELSRIGLRRAKVTEGLTPAQTAWPNWSWQARPTARSHASSSNTACVLSSSARSIRCRRG